MLSVVLAMVFATVVAVATQPAQAVFPGANGWIVYDNGVDIYAMPSDGSAAPTNLTNPGPVLADVVADPVFSPDGTKIAFARSVAGQSSLWVGTFTPGNPPTLTSIVKVSSPAVGDADGEPTWSPNQTTLAFHRRVAYNFGTGSATSDNLGTTLVDTAATFVTAGVDVGMTVMNVDDASQGLVVSVDSETQLTLDGLTGGTVNSWTTGDTYTVGHLNRRIFTTPASASGPDSQLTAAGAGDLFDDLAPVWSPANDLIAFESNRTGLADIFTIPVGGGTEVNRTDVGAFDAPAQRPSWSPDGQHIAFHAAEPNTTGNNRNVWRLTLPSAFTQLTGELIIGSTGTDDDLFPTFSPDGSLVAFQRSGTGGNTIWTVSAVNGSGLTQVRTEFPPHSQPDWQPQLVGVADSGYVVDEGDDVTVAAPGVLANDVFLTTAIGNATAVKVSDPAHGTVSVGADGSFTYVHDGSESVADSFSYRPVQGGVLGSVAVVSVSVTPVNDPPEAVDDGPFAVAVAGGSFVAPAPGVLANDSDPEGDALTAVKVSDPVHGSVTLNADGSFTYMHDGSGAMADSFTYQAEDGSGALSNVATVSLTIGAPPVVPVVYSTGLVDPGQGLWRLYDDAGGLETSFFFGNPGDFPIFGDWDGDGVETPGMYRQSDGFVYLRNSNTQGAGEVRFFFGNPGDVPIAGDFDGDGFDTVSIYRPASQEFFIINELGANEGGLGAAEFSYVFGDPGDKPFVGDFDGDGVETVGLHRESTGLVYFRNSHTQGVADAQFIFGDPGDRLIAGDWNGDGKYSPALFRPSNTTMFFRFTNTQGVADNSFVPVPAGSTWLPIAGLVP